MKRSILPFTIGIFLISGLACDSSSSGTDDATAEVDGAATPDGGSETTPPDVATTPDTSAVDGAPPSCDLFPDRAELVVSSSRFKAKADDERGGAMRIMYAANSDDPFHIRVMLWEGLAGSLTEPSTTKLQDVPKDLSGGVLVRFGHGCDTQGRDCTTDFVGFEGSLVIDALEWAEPDGKTFSGELQKVLFKQVTYEANELAVEVPGGCSFTLDAHAFSGSVSTSSGGGGGGG